MKKRKKRLNNKRRIALFLSAAVAVTTVLGGSFPRERYRGQKAAASEKVYGNKLKLNHEIKLNTTKTYTKNGFVKETTFFPKKKTVKTKYTISSKRKSEGNKYKVTYQVEYRYLNDPKLSEKKVTYDDWAWGYYYPREIYTVFDYRTGKTLEKKNNLGVKVKGGKWKYSYYPKQYYKYTGSVLKNYTAKERSRMKKECWIRNEKAVSVQFTVTYPKKCKDVVVGIGFMNDPRDPREVTPETKYWKGKEVYGNTIYYKHAKKTISYMRLNG